MIPFGEILWKLRDSRSLSQKQLARKLGVSDSIIARYETGDRFPSLTALIDIARTFGVTTDYLLGLETTKSDVLDVSGLTAEQIRSISAIIDNYRALQI